MRERLPGGVCVGGFLSFLDGLEAAFGRWVVAPLESVIFFDVAFWSDETTIPIVVLWLILAAVFFTLRFQFINLRAFRHGAARPRRPLGGHDPGHCHQPVRVRHLPPPGMKGTAMRKRIASICLLATCLLIPIGTRAETEIATHLRFGFAFDPLRDGEDVDFDGH